MYGPWEGAGISAPSGGERFTSLQASWETLLEWNDSCSGRIFSGNQVRGARQQLGLPVEEEGPRAAEAWDSVSEASGKRPRSVAGVDLARSLRRGAPWAWPEGGGESLRFKSAVSGGSRSAAILFLCDSSPSMDLHRRTLALTVASCSVLSLRSRYAGLDVRAIAYGRGAQVSPPRDLFRQACPDGARVSGAYQLARALLDRDWAALAGPIFLQHFSDGNNWSPLDNEHSVRNASGILPWLSALDYVEVGEGAAFTTLMATFGRISHHAFRAWRVTTQAEAALAGAVRVAD